MNTDRINEGDWIEYRSSEGWIGEAKVLEIRPDGIFIVGQHDGDPSTEQVQPNEVKGFVE